MPFTLFPPSTNIARLIVELTIDSMIVDISEVSKGSVIGLFVINSDKSASATSEKCLTKSLSVTIPAKVSDPSAIIGKLPKSC